MVFFRLNPVFLSALWKWCICRMTSLEVQQSRWDWTKGATMCSCLTAFQDWKLHFLFERRFFFLDCWRKMKRGWKGVDRHASTLTGRAWDKRLLQHFDNRNFFLVRTLTITQLYIYWQLFGRNNKDAGDPNSAAVILKHRYLLTGTESSWPLLNGIIYISSEVHECCLYCHAAEIVPFGLLKPSLTPTEDISPKD